MSVQKQIDRLLAQRAAEWFEVYRTGQEDQYPAFVAWLSESPRHLQEFLEIAGRYAAIRNVLRSSAFDHEALLCKLAPQVRSLHPPMLPNARRRLAWNSKRSWAAGLAAAMLIAIFLFFGRPGLLSGNQSFATQTGEQRVIQLPDGSVLTLNAQSRVAVRLGRSQRSVRLVHGEALFKVAPDKTRPFLVHTQSATVRAIGTQFSVYARPDGSTAVAVLEGRVEVSSPIETTHETILPADESTSRELVARVSLGRGEAARVAPTGTIKRDKYANIPKALAWRQRRLVFDRTPLEDVVMEFNRYNQMLKFRLENVQPRSYHFTGSFDADDPRSLALLLSKEPKLVVEDRGEEILIRRR